MMSAVHLREDVVEVPMVTAARVAEVSRRRLSSWADADLLKPSSARRHGQRRVWGYGFDELVLARIIRELERGGVHITQVHRIVEAAREALGTRDVTRLKWATSGGEAFVQFPNGSWFGGRKPNQARISGVLDLGEIRAETRRRIVRPASMVGRIEHRRATHGSRAVFAGTRVPVDTVVRYLRAGKSDAAIRSSFPVLRKADIQAARRLID
jgi:uncharacterized protein (DUF433 family)